MSENLSRNHLRLVVMGSGLALLLVSAAVVVWLFSMTKKVSTHPDGSVRFESLAGWAGDDHGAALRTFRRSCEKIATRPDSEPMGSAGGMIADWRTVCESALSQSEGISAADARAFFETRFKLLPIEGGEGNVGLFTGYFEPEVAGSLTESIGFSVPLYTRPADLVRLDDQVPRHADATGLKFGRVVDGEALPYFSRREIEQGVFKGTVPVLVYLKDKIDAFFVHIQGSSRIRLPDETVMRVAFAGKSGRPYTPIGRILIDRGEIAREEMSMQSIKAWLKANPKSADEIMWHNQSFIFFRQVAMTDPELGPPGAQGVSLTPGRSLAVDRKLHGYGTPFWLDTAAPAPSGQGDTPFQRLMIAQDTGSAILGAVRGDVFWGSGPSAGAIAGRMQHRGKLYSLVPRELASRLLAAKATAVQ